MRWKKAWFAVNADLSPDRRLQASNGQARNLYQELTRNIATRAHPEGNAMIPIIEKFITVQRSEAEKQGKDVEVLIKEKLSSLSELVGGYDFAKVIAAYWRGYNEDNEELKSRSRKISARRIFHPHRSKKRFGRKNHHR